MLGFVLEGANKVCWKDDLPVMKVGPLDALVKPTTISPCTTDIHLIKAPMMPAIIGKAMGHECVGIVEEVGKDVKNLKPGDRVTLEPGYTCGKCEYCMSGRYNLCPDVVFMATPPYDGAFCEYVAWPAHMAFKLPDNMSYMEGALVEPLSVGVGSIKRSRMFKGGNVVVVGAGTIGKCVAQAAKNLGAAKVMVTDINQDKLDYALECGMDYAVDTTKISLKDAIDQNFGVRKADVIVDCVAAPPVFQTILDATRPSSEIVITGNYKAPITLEVPRIQRREVEILGHMMYVREDFADAIRLLAEGKINTRKLISQRWSFEQYAEAFIFADAHPLDVMKMVVKVAKD